MADPMTLIEYADKYYQDRKSQKDAAQTDLKTAQDNGVAARQSLDQAIKDYADLEKQVASIRQQLAAITTPADAAPLLDQLGQKLILLHAKNAELLKYDTQFKEDQIKIGLAQTTLQRVLTALDEAQAQKDQAQKDEDRRTALKDSLSAPPLDTIKADATALLGDPIFTDAETRIKGDIPDVLRNRANNRAMFTADSVDRADTVLQDVQSLMKTFLDAKGAAIEKLTYPKAAVEIAEAKLADYVANAKARYDRAKAILDALGDPNKPHLTQEQQENINTSDTTLESDREEAADKEKTRDEKRDDRDAKQAVYDVEALKVSAKGGADALNAALADNTSDVYQAKADLDQAKSDLVTAEGEYETAMRNTLDEWEAAVPEATWHDLSDFEWAKDTLTDLSTSTTDYEGDLSTAETNLLTALLQWDKDAHEQAAYQTELDLRAATLKVKTDSAVRAEFSALRGDA